MSHQNIPTVCLVIDASVARAAGPLSSTHPTGAICREFLQKVRGVGHRVAWNSAIKAEWDKHQSSFARTWLVSMQSIGKVRHLAEGPIDPLRDAVQQHAGDPGVLAAMVKDVHLVEAALNSDRRVASLDETVRGHFGRLSATFADLQSLLWANPTREAEKVTDWIENGAPDEAHRRLGS